MHWVQSGPPSGRPCRVSGGWRPPSSASTSTIASFRWGNIFRLYSKDMIEIDINAKWSVILDNPFQNVYFLNHFFIISFQLYTRRTLADIGDIAPKSCQNSIYMCLNPPWLIFLRIHFKTIYSIRSVGIVFVLLFDLMKLVSTFMKGRVTTSICINLFNRFASFFEIVIFAPSLIHTHKSALISIFENSLLNYL